MPASKSQQNAVIDAPGTIAASYVKLYLNQVLGKFLWFGTLLLSSDKSPFRKANLGKREI